MNTTYDPLVYSKKLHELWMGRNRFLLDGKCFLGSEYQKGISMLFMLLVQYLLMIIFVIGMQINGLMCKCTCIFIQTLLLYFCFHNGLKCIVGDPGAMPNNFHNLYSHKRANILFLKEKGKPRYYNLRGYIFQIKMCKTCLIIRPLATSHCSQCGICVERYDHHCPWLGNCIGRNNYRSFLIFLLMVDIWLINSIILCYAEYDKLHSCTHFIDTEWIYTGVNNYTKYNCSEYIELNITLDCNPVNLNYIERKIPFEYKNHETIRQYMAIFIGCFSFLAFVFVITLSFFHMKFSMKFITTALYAKIKPQLIIFGNPFDRGFKKNIKKIFCTSYRQRIDYSQVVTLAIPSEVSELLEKSRHDDHLRLNDNVRTKCEDNIHSKDLLDNSRQRNNLISLISRLTHKPITMLKSKTYAEDSTVLPGSCINRSTFILPKKKNRHKKRRSQSTLNRNSNIQFTHIFHDDHNLTITQFNSIRQTFSKIYS